MIESLITAINQINQFEEQKDTLSKLHSEIEKRINDLEHYIEYETFNAYQGYVLAHKLKRLREERRKFKNKLILIGTFEQHSNKLIELNNRKLLISFIAKTNKSLENSEYNYELLKKEEIDQLIGKRRV